MKSFFVDGNNISGDTLKITGDEFFHLSKVLRAQSGEKIICLTGDEFDYVCELSKIEKNQAEAKLIEKKLNKCNPKIVIDVFQGLPKGEKAELIVQKITELGASTLIFFESDFTVAKIKSITKIDRLTKIAKEACKQCGRSQPLNIKNSIKLSEIKNLLNGYDIIFFFNENADEECALKKLAEKLKVSKRIAVIIGAEGGFSDKETTIFDELSLKNLFNVSLGERILRTETASIGAVAYISFLTGN